MDERVSALENDVRELRERVRRTEQDAAAARVLAGGADRDVAELHGDVRGLRSELHEFRDQNNRLLTAMRADLTDLRDHVDRGFARIDERFAVAHQNFLTVHSKIDGVAAGLQVITDLLTRRECDDPPAS
jgi:predicted  nucleic acid-binding Zn-ribbon protein